MKPGGRSRFHRFDPINLYRQNRMSLSSLC